MQNNADTMKLAILSITLILAIFLLAGCTGGDMSSGRENTNIDYDTSRDTTSVVDVSSLGICGTFVDKPDTGSLCPTLESLITYIESTPSNYRGYYSGDYILLNISEIIIGKYTVHEQTANCVKGSEEGENVNYYYCELASGGYGGGVTATLTDAEGNILVQVENDARFIFSIENGQFVYQGTECQRNLYGCPWHRIE